MEVYLSEEEQWQKIKEWWKKNGNFILIVVIIGFGLSFGWRYWRVAKGRREIQASLLYTNLINLDLAHKSIDVKLMADHLRANYSSTPYADLASLLLAKSYVANGKLTDALSQLHLIIKKSSNKSIQQIAKIRAARILLAEKKQSEALNLLKQVGTGEYSSVAKEVAGDVYLSVGDKANALANYKIAQKATAKNVVTAAILKMKIEQLQ